MLTPTVLENVGLTATLPFRTTKLNQLERKFKIPSVKRPYLGNEVIVQAVVDEVGKDIMQNNGPGYIKSKLKDKHVMVPR